MAQQAGFIPMPISVFLSWKFSEFYLFFYLRKHCRPDGIFRINNFVGLKKDRFCFHRSTYFKARNFLEKQGIISIKHPPNGVNSGSKTDGRVGENYLKMSYKKDTVLVLKSYLENIKNEEEWKKYRLIILKKYWEQSGSRLSFRNWLSKEYFCPISKIKMKPKSSNYHAIKTVLNDKMDTLEIFFRGNAFGRKVPGSDQVTSHKTEISKSTEVQKKTGQSVRKATVIVEKDKLYVKQFKGQEKPSGVSSFKIPYSDFVEFKNCFLQLHMNNGISVPKEGETNLLISLAYLSKIKRKELQNTPYPKICRLALGNYALIETSSVPTTGKYSNRFLKFVEKNGGEGVFQEYVSYRRKMDNSAPRYSRNELPEKLDTGTKESAGNSQKDVLKKSIVNRLLSDDAMAKQCFGEKYLKARVYLKSGHRIPREMWVSGYEEISGYGIEL